MARNIESMSSAQLVAYYNELTGEQVKKFSDRQTGIKRVQRVLAELEAAAEPDKLLDVPVEQPVTAEATKYYLPSFVGAPHAAQPVVAPKPVKQAAPPAGKRAEYDTTHAIKLLTHVNPKKPGTATFDRFEKYVDGMTVAEALKAGITREDLCWDEAHKYIKCAPIK